ncbi:YhjD/YihY/BrkB family envelope integrity protein [Yinghuangia seranimata]|uniref:YhjD/YihY/BrkB family envelope integrity protein n=1 Tax=Yinghuangia seranimata TaxID=408067 RepID=UPI00248C742C|nr:YhjD/YihY/BrkB family envelope integrity protein [Yinghuangia seranimata]MDI2124991.1 YhjD/YihY/BrkB family envelope integrity protein [Yinghuangia seranimata]
MTAPSERPDGPSADRAPQAGESAESGRVRRAAAWAKRKYAGSWAEHLWGQLDAVDFINRSMLLAATLLLCAVPFLLVLVALEGRSAASGLSRRMGLNKEAADDVGQLFTTSADTSAAVTGLSWAFFILAGIGAATAVQQVYQRVFDVQPRRTRDRLGALAWLALLVGVLSLAGWVMPGLHASVPVLFWIVSLVLVTAFWWCGMWLLLAGGLGWRRLLPCAVATGACWTGMQAVFSVIFSGMITEYDRKYGSIGVVFAFMSFFIAIGVVLILGAALGLVWQERGLSFRAAVAKMRRTS